MAEKFININFPFKDSVKGFFLDLNNTDEKAIKADLMHLILTNKGERFYDPEFGTNLKKYIFEPSDGTTYSSIKAELIDAVKKYLPNLIINEVIVETLEDNELVAKVRIDYTLNQNAFQLSDFIEIQL